jgi:branched-chain amino acid transport system substrate-binding protein
MLDWRKGMRRRLVILSLVPVLLAACGGSGGSSAAKPPYTIDVIIPLTGGAAFLGTAEQQALQALKKVVNDRGGIQGRPLDFNIHDDTTSPTVAVQLADQIIAKKVPVFLGPSLVALCKAIQPLLTDGPVMYCFSPGIHPVPGSFAFTASVSTTDLMKALFAFFNSKSWTQIGVLTSTDATGQDADAAIKATLALADNSAFHVSSWEHFTPTDVSVSAQLTRIKASGAQALITWSTGTPVATVFKGVAQAGLDIPVATTDGNMTYAQMKQYKDFLPSQLYIPSPEWPAYQSLPAGPVKDALKTYYDAFNAQGIKPDIGQSLAWDPALIVVAALQHLGPNATAGQLKDYINKLSGFAGVNGRYDFIATPQRGLTARQAIVTRWDSTQQTWVPASSPGG